MDAAETQKLPALFDIDVDAYHPTNRRAAAARGLRYDPKTETYLDEDKFSILDRFAQPFI